MAKLNSKMLDACTKWISENGLSGRCGATVRDFCTQMGISKTTYYNWMENVYFVDAIKKGNEMFEDKVRSEVVQSLIKAATGYDYIEVRTKEKEDGTTETTTITKHVEANITACIFLLTNVAPEHWKHKQEIKGLELRNTALNITVQDTDTKKLVEKLREK